MDASLEQDTVQLAGGETADLPSKEDLTRHLLFIVSERTGYPTEMLPMDEDIEARLGIDSIKRVEILGALQREYIPADQRIGPEAMEQLTAIKTLQGVVDWFDDALRGVSGQPVASRRLRRPASVAEDEIEIARSRPALVDAPAVMDRTLDVASGQVFLITDDGRGVAARVADQLRQCGAHPVLLLGAGTDTQGEDIYQVDLGNAAAVQAVVAQVRSALGPIAGLVHLAGLGERRDFRDMSVADWRNCQRRE